MFCHPKILDMMLVKILTALNTIKTNAFDVHIDSTWRILDVSLCLINVKNTTENLGNAWHAILDISYPMEYAQPWINYVNWSINPEDALNAIKDISLFRVSAISQLLKHHPLRLPHLPLLLHTRLLIHPHPTLEEKHWTHYVKNLRITFARNVRLELTWAKNIKCVQLKIPTANNSIMLIKLLLNVWEGTQFRLSENVLELDDITFFYIFIIFSSLFQSYLYCLIYIVESYV